MSEMNPKVDGFFHRANQWQEEYKELRSIVLDCELNEELKWGVPCYTYEDKNILLIHGFKNYCAILFINGALLKDTLGILIQQTKNVQAARQVRFTNVDEIIEMEHVLKAYIREAIDVEKTGLKVNYKKTEEYEVPVEFQSKLDELPDLKKAFLALSPGRQRGYLYYFSQPKTSKTRDARVQSSIQKILDGKGLND